MNKDFLLKDFNNTENKMFVSKIIDKIEFSLRKNKVVFTDFLNPNEQFILFDLLRNFNDINYKFFGGFDDSERKILCFYPEYINILEYDFPIKVLKIKVNKKFSKNISHRDYLGSLLSIGIKREKLGDILVFDDYALCFVYENIVEYISFNLLKISNISIKNEILNIDEDLKIPNKTLLTKRIVVSSLRLDNIISKICNISRKQSQELIKIGVVSINWKIMKNISEIINKNDIISIRGKGRFVISEICGRTKKDRIIIVFSMYV